MLADADEDAPAFDPPDAESVYRNYLERAVVSALSQCKGIVRMS